MNYKTRQPFPHAAYVEGQRNFTYFDRSLTSGLTDVIIESPGDFLYIDQASTGVVSVELNMRQGGTLAPILLAAGGSIECDFASIKLTASAQLNKSVRIIVGNGAKIKGGANVNAESANISSVDGGRVRTDQLQAIVGNAYSAPLAGNYSHVQILNPSGSGLNCYINVIHVSCSSGATFVNVGRSTTVLTNSSSGPGALVFKKSDEGLSGIQCREQRAAAGISDAYVFQVPTPVNTTTPIALSEPILLPAGYGLIFQNQAVNSDLLVNAQGWIE